MPEGISFENDRGSESPRAEKHRVLEATPENNQELIVTESEAELEESKSIYAIGKGFETFDQMPPLERAVFWTIENAASDNYLQAEEAAKEAGLDRKGQLGYKLKALETRMSALSRSADKNDVEEFYRLDTLNASAKQELKEVK